MFDKQTATLAEPRCSGKNSSGLLEVYGGHRLYDMEGYLRKIGDAANEAGACLAEPYMHYARAGELVLSRRTFAIPISAYLRNYTHARCICETPAPSVWRIKFTPHDPTCQRPARVRLAAPVWLRRNSTLMMSVCSSIGYDKRTSNPGCLNASQAWHRPLGAVLRDALAFLRAQRELNGSGFSLVLEAGPAHSKFIAHSKYYDGKYHTLRSGGGSVALGPATSSGALSSFHRAPVNVVPLVSDLLYHNSTAGGANLAGLTRGLCGPGERMHVSATTGAVGCIHLASLPSEGMMALAERVVDRYLRTCNAAIGAPPARTFAAVVRLTYPTPKGAEGVRLRCGKMWEAIRNRSREAHRGRHTAHACRPTSYLATDWFAGADAGQSHILPYDAALNNCWEAHMGQPSSPLYYWPSEPRLLTPLIQTAAPHLMGVPNEYRFAASPTREDGKRRLPPYSHLSESAFRAFLDLAVATAVDDCYGWGHMCTTASQYRVRVGKLPCDCVSMLVFES